MSDTGAPSTFQPRRAMGFKAVNPKAGMVTQKTDQQPTIQSSGPQDKPSSVMAGQIRTPVNVANKNASDIQTLSIQEIREGEDVHQVPYKPKSKMMSTGAMISSSMANATYMALDALENRHGSIDDYVMSKIGMSPDQLKKALSAEQVDAVALEISAIENGREFILGDVTGFGKGRVLASVATFMLRTGKKVVFMSEKANLFTDFWRDISDIGMAEVFGEPIILNKDKSRIIDMNNVGKNGKPKILFKHEPKMIQDLLDTQKWPENHKIIFSTYSQFNRAEKYVYNQDTGTGSFVQPVKTKALIELVKNALLICDESHNVVQDSNIGIAIQEAKRNAVAVINSSATNGRSVSELMAYGKVMPWLLPISAFGGHDFKAMGYVNRRAMAEASTVRAAREGALVSRQHDMSKMVMKLIDVAEDDPKIEQYEEAFSLAARKLTALWQLTSHVVAEMNNNSDGKWTATAPNFGSIYSLLSSNFSVVLRLEYAVNYAKSILLEGKKYIGVLNTTQEASMRMILEAHKQYETFLSTMDADDEPPPVLKRLQKKPDFKDLIRLAAHRLTRVLIREGRETRHINLDSGQVINLLDELEKVLSSFPDFPISPLDYLRTRIEAEGEALLAAGVIKKPWRVGEISGRGLGIDQDGNIIDWSGEDRNDTIYGFNNGGSNWYDALLLTRAGAVGLSLHDAHQFKSHGVRHMQEIETNTNVLERIQMWGRVARRGQITDPEFSMLSSSMPGDLYALSSQSKKVADVSAVVSGSAKSLRMVKGVPDPIDAAGERAAKGILGDNPSLRQSLMISSGDNDSTDEDGLDIDDRADEFATAFALLRRIRLLHPLSMQRHVFDQFLRRREEIVMAYPEEPPVLGGIWTEIESTVIDPAGKYHGQIKMIKIETDRSVVPLDSKRIRAMIASNRSEATLEPMVKLIDEQRKDFLADQASKLGIDNWQAVLRTGGDSPIKTLAKDIEILKRLVQTIKASCIVKIPDEGGQPKPVIVTRVNCRSMTKACLPRAYEIEFVRAGDDQPGRISLEPMVRMPQLYGLYEPAISLDKALASFDKVLSRSNKITRNVLCGDPVDEVMTAVRLRGGSRASFKLKTPSGVVWQHGILVPKHLEKRVFKIPVRIGDPDRALSYLKNSKTPLKTDPLAAAKGLVLVYEPATYKSNNMLKVRDDQGAPPTLRSYLNAMAHKNKIAHGFNDGYIRISLDEDILAFINMMMEAGIPIYADGADRDYFLGENQLANPRQEAKGEPFQGARRVWNSNLDFEP